MHTAEIETLKADIETYIKISSDQANIIEALQNLAQKAKDNGFKIEPGTILFLIEECAE